MSEPRDILRHYLETAADIDALDALEREQHRLTNKELACRIRQFVLSEGEWFDPWPLRPDVDRKAHGQCFYESMFLSIGREWTYVEGFALTRASYKSSFR